TCPATSELSPLSLHDALPISYMLFLRGQHYLAARTEEGLRKAIECFELALESDPGYALAYAGLANAYVLFGFDEYRGQPPSVARSEEHTSELQSRGHLVCRLL